MSRDMVTEAPTNVELGNRAGLSSCQSTVAVAIRRIITSAKFASVSIGTRAGIAIVLYIEYYNFSLIH